MKIAVALGLARRAGLCALAATAFWRSPASAETIYFGLSTTQSSDYGEQLVLPSGFGAGEFTLELRVRADESFPVGSTGSGENQLRNWSSADPAPYSSGDWWYAGNFLLDGHNNSTFANGTFSLQVYGGGCVRWLFGDGTSSSVSGDLWAVQARPESAACSLLDGEWHIVTLVRRYEGATGATLELWQDGVLLANESIPSRVDMRTWWNSWSGFPSGQRGWFWAAEKQAAISSSFQWEDYKGWLDELRFWSRAKAPSEISASLAPLTGSEPGLVGQYEFQEASGDSTCDSLNPSRCIGLINAPNVWLAEPGTDPAPTLAFSAAATTVDSGESTTLTWSTNDATGCTASGGWSGSRPTQGSESTGALTAQTVYTLACSGTGGSVSRSVTVSVVQPPPPPDPSVSLSASATDVEAGQSVVLSWTSSAVTSCSASNGWGGSKSSDGSETVGPLTADTIFVLICTGAGGSASDSVTVTVATEGDTTPPGISQVLADSDPQHVLVVFDEIVDATTSQVASNYTISDGVAVLSAALLQNARTVVLETSPLQAGPYLLTVNDVFDPAANAIAPDTEVAFQHVAGVVSGNTNPPSYLWSRLQQNDLVYVDRAWIYTTVPVEYLNFQYLMTRNDDNSSVGDPFVTFDVNQDVTVYVAYDDSLASPPAWLSGWSDVGAMVAVAHTLNVSDAVHRLRSRDFAAGTIELGGNESGGGMYTVLVSPDVDDPAPPPTLDLSASSTNIQSGATTVLTWRTSNATDCTASGDWSASRMVQGAEVVGPLTREATFTLTCEGGGGTVARSVTVNVVDPPPPAPGGGAEPSSGGSGGLGLLGLAALGLALVARRCVGRQSVPEFRRHSAVKSVGGLGFAAAGAPDLKPACKVQPGLPPAE